MDEDTPGESAAQPAHRVQLPGQQWALWRWSVLRSAGFPIKQLDSLSTPFLVTAAKAVMSAQKQLHDARAMAITECQQALMSAEGRTRTQLGKCLHMLKHGKLLPVGGHFPLDGSLNPVYAAQVAYSQAWERYRDAYEQETLRLSAALLEHAAEPLFREAIAWQNPHALEHGIDVLLRNPTRRRGSKRRQHEAMVVNYLQRYCAKNDTIGFFGPIAWSRLGFAETPISVILGSQLIKKATVYLEAWGIQALAQSLASDPALELWCAPRLNPRMHLANNSLHLPRGAPYQLSNKQVAVIAACDGTTLAHTIIEGLFAQVGISWANRKEISSILRQLRSMSIIIWTLEVPMKLHAEETLRACLERIETPDVRTRALEQLLQLEAARRDLAASFGAAEKVQAGLARLGHTFTELTHQLPTRSHGKTYASRTLAYLECQRGIDVEIGAGILCALAKPLGLVLDSARWFTAQTAAVYRKAFAALYAQLVQRSGSSVVSAVSFWEVAQPYFFDEKKRLIDGVSQRLHQRWAAILGEGQRDQRAIYASSDLRPLVDRHFAAEQPGWSSACYHSPDIMLAADSIAAIHQDDYMLVLGELHPAANTLSATLFLSQHPHIEEIYQGLEADMPRPRVVLIPPESWPGRTTRTTGILISPKDFLLVAAPSGGAEAATERRLPIGSLVVEERNNQLIVRTRDGEYSWDIIEVFADILSMLTMRAYSLREVAPGSHAPRLVIDRLVVARETWSFLASSLTFAFEAEELPRFIAAYEWKQTHGIPERIFIKSSAEAKPVYIDLGSPVFIDIFTRIIRRAADTPDGKIVVSEMLPATEQCWLPDAADQRYTSEFRCVAVDLSAA